MPAQGVTTISNWLHPQHLAAYAWLNTKDEMPVRMAFSLETTNRNPNVEPTMARLLGIQGGTGKSMWGLGDESYANYPKLVDHCRYINNAHAVRAQKLGIISSCGPKYIYPGARGDIGAYSILYGPEIAADVVVPLRRLIDHNLRTTMQLDQHGFHPFLALQVAVTRKDFTDKVWGPQQRINRREALYTYTRWSAEYVLRENMLGSIEPGKYADFTVLKQDYLTVLDDEIALIDPVLTVMGGKIVYTEPQFATSLGLPQVGFSGNPTWWLRGRPEEANRGSRGGGG